MKLKREFNKIIAASKKVNILEFLMDIVPEENVENILRKNIEMEVPVITLTRIVDPFQIRFQNKLQVANGTTIPTLETSALMVMKICPCCWSVLVLQPTTKLHATW